jgi:hypothetical protein
MKLIRSTLAGLYVNFILVILLLVSLVSGLINNSMGDWKQWLIISLLIITSILNTLFAVINIKNAIQMVKRNEYKSLRKSMKVLKLGAIPYFIINFLIYLMLFLLLFAASRGIILFSPIPLMFLIPITFTYLTVLFTSSYGIGYVVIIGKEKRLKKSKLLIHILMQLCFVLDIFSTIVLLRKYKLDHIYD